MLPKWHVLWGAILTIFLYIIAPNTEIYNLILLFLASFLIDVDHYLVGVMNTKSISLKKAVQYNHDKNREALKERDKGIKKKGDFHLFHTLEFHLLIGILGLIWLPFFYIFIGLVYHSLFDIVYLFNKGYLYRREFFFVNWASKKFKRKN